VSCHGIVENAWVQISVGRTAMARGRRLKIWLYTAITEQEQFQPLARPALQRAKSMVRHGLNRLSTRLTGRLHVDNFHYQVANSLADNSNRGDIAIRVAVRQQFLAALAPRPVEFVELKWGDLTDQAVDRINRECDLFIIAGGGYIFINGDGTGQPRLNDIPFLQKIECPVIAYGIGMNRLLHEEVCDLNNLPSATQSLVRGLRSACDDVGVRDAETLELMNLYGGGPSSLIGDPVLFMYNTFATEKNRAAVRRPLIGINFAGHGFHSQSMLKSLLPAAVEFLKHVQIKYGAAFIYLLHHDFEENVVAFLRQQGLRFDVVHSDLSQLFDSYRGLDFVICQMLHSCIFASNQNTPFLNIAYDRKSVAFCDLLGVPQCALVHGDATVSALSARFEELFAERDAIRRTLAAGKAPLNLAQREFVRRAAAFTESAVPSG